MWCRRKVSGVEAMTGFVVACWLTASASAALASDVVTDPAPIIQAASIASEPIVPGERPVVPSPLSPSSTEPPPSTEPTTTTTEPTMLPMTFAPTASSSFFDDGQLGHYLAWYGAEYVATASIAGLFALGVQELIPPAPALIGPRVDVDEMDVAVLLDPRLDGLIGQPFLKEQVSTTALVGVGVALIAATAGLDYATTGDVHRAHGLLVGGAEAMTATALLTEGLKLSFGRLRPDFRDRYENAACTGVVATPAGLDCATVDTSRFRITAEGLRDGMKSFVSGHSSSAFAMATFSSWWLGSTLVWGKDRPAWGPAVGSAAMGTLLAGAGYVASTRLSDHKHHPEDVVVGSLLGATVATAAWFVHFDLDGRARRRSFTVVPTVGVGDRSGGSSGTGLAVVGALP